MNGKWRWIEFMVLGEDEDKREVLYRENMYLWKNIDSNFMSEILVVYILFFIYIKFIFLILKGGSF